MTLHATRRACKNLPTLFNHRLPLLRGRHGRRQHAPRSSAQLNEPPPPTWPPACVPYLPMSAI
eukprot:12846007-Prorocentrum_lima.AAC.1